MIFTIFALLLWVASQAGTPGAPVTAFDRRFFHAQPQMLNYAKIAVTP